MKKNRKLFAAVCWLAAFALWTVAVCTVDIQTIGPLDSQVGFGAVNGFAHRIIWVNPDLYLLTDWLSLIPIGFMLGFGILGLTQWIHRKNIWMVDFDILALGGFYVVVAAVFVLFEVAVVNYRPVLIEGILEASYPSSTTMLVMCVLPTAVMQLKRRMQNRKLMRVTAAAITLFGALMVAGRLFSGVHWITDIIGGCLLSAGLVLLYDAVCDAVKKEQ